MAERGAMHEQGADAPHGVRPPPLPAPLPPCRVYCVKCAADVTVLPPAARFCRRCGAALPDRSVLGAPFLPPGNAGPAPIHFPPHDIVLGYARALYALGQRYETAVGSRRNVAEAARCYWKASKLGEVATVGRVAAAAPEVLSDLPLPSVADPVAPPLATVYAPPAA